jgi:hypothetical protein
MKKTTAPKPTAKPAPNKGKPHCPPSATISVRLPVSLLGIAKIKARGLGITMNKFAVQAILEALSANSNTDA